MTKVNISKRVNKQKKPMKKNEKYRHKPQHANAYDKA